MVTMVVMDFPFQKTSELMKTKFRLAKIGAGKSLSFASPPPAPQTAPSPLSRLTHSWLDDGHALVAGSLFVALGLAMFAHAGLLTGGVAGVNIVAQWLQQSRGIRAGHVQMSVDIAVVLAALAVVPPERVLQSVVGAVAIGAILTLNHRPGRYLGV